MIGQDEAISVIASAIRRSRTGLSSARRPLGSFVFLGPTGVGKTLVAKTLAQFLFGDEEALVRIDMSDFMEKHNVSRLVGAPPGYVGYEEGGLLTEKIRRRPFSVILLDEIEKAHPDVFNILLQVLEEGQLSDNLGHAVSFRNAVLIMTSNLGAREINKDSSLGFQSEEGGMNFKDIRNFVMNEVKRAFNPEFINRIDEIVVFHNLDKTHLAQIFDLMVKEISDRLVDQKITIVVQKKRARVPDREGLRREVRRPAAAQAAAEGGRGPAVPRDPEGASSRPGTRSTSISRADKITFRKQESRKALKGPAQPAGLLTGERRSRRPTRWRPFQIDRPGTGGRGSSPSSSPVSPPPRASRGRWMTCWPSERKPLPTASTRLPFPASSASRMNTPRVPGPMRPRTSSACRCSTPVDGRNAFPRFPSWESATPSPSSSRGWPGGWETRIFGWATGSAAFDNLSEFLRTAGGASPFRLNALLDRAVALEGLGRDEEAAAAYRQLLADPAAAAYTAEAIFRLAGTEYRAGRYASARDLYGKVLLDNPATVPGGIQSATVPGGIQAGSRFVRDAVFLVGECELALGRTAEAEKRFMTILSLYPDSPYVEAASFRLVDIAGRQGRASTLRQADDYLARFPGGAHRGSALRLKGDILLSRKMTAEALAAYTQSVAALPDGPEKQSAWYSMALAQSSLGRKLDAADSFARAATGGSGEIAEKAGFQRAVILAGEGKSKEAVEALRGFLQAFPRSSHAEEAGRLLGRLLAQQGDPEASRALWDSMARLFPGPARYLSISTPAGRASWRSDAGHPPWTISSTS